MAQRSHVPEFGNWDCDNNVPYTAYFENARKGKIGSGRMNPNDPEENPDAFSFPGIMNGISDTSIDSSAPLQKSNNGKAIPSEKHYGHHRNACDQQKSVSQKSLTSTTSESGRDKSNSVKANHNRNLHQRKRSENKKSISENSPNIFALSPSPGRNRLRGGGANGSDDLVSNLLGTGSPVTLLSYKSTSVPKFGAWDDGDARSAEGYTVIFNKVKEEKQIAAGKLPTIEPEDSNVGAENKKRGSRSKILCCLF